MLAARYLLVLGLLALWLGVSSRLKADESIPLCGFAHGDGFVVSTDAAAKLPPWTPQSGNPAPFSMDNAWKLIHDTGQKSAGDAPFWTTYVQVDHGHGKGNDIWFYRADGSYVAYRDNKAYSEEVSYVILMDGTMLTQSYEYPDGRTLPPNYVRPSIQHPPKPRTPSLPPEVNLLDATYSRLGKQLKVPYTVPRERFLAMPAWYFNHPEPPPVSLDQALQAVRTDAQKQWPNRPWFYVNISLEPGKSNDSNSICFYIITIESKTADPINDPAVLLLRVVPMDGKLVGPDAALVTPYGSGVGD